MTANPATKAELRFSNEFVRKQVITTVSPNQNVQLQLAYAVFCAASLFVILFSVLSPKIALLASTTESSGMIRNRRPRYMQNTPNAIMSGDNVSFNVAKLNFVPAGIDCLSAEKIRADRKHSRRIARIAFEQYLIE